MSKFSWAVLAVAALSFFVGMGLVLFDILSHPQSVTIVPTSVTRIAGFSLISLGFLVAAVGGYKCRKKVK